MELIRIKEKNLTLFVEQVLCNENKHGNAVMFFNSSGDDFEDYEVRFLRDHEKHYCELLKYCAENEIIILSTHPGTLSTIVRVRG